MDLENGWIDEKRLGVSRGVGVKFLQKVWDGLEEKIRVGVSKIPQMGRGFEKCPERVGV